MADDFRSYTLDVDLEKMPGGWLLFAIGEGKPVIAPPPVMDEIKTLRSKLDRYRSALEDVRHTIDEQLGDTDPPLDEGITDEELRSEEPLFWCHKRIAEALDGE